MPLSPLELAKKHKIDVDQHPEIQLWSSMVEKTRYPLSFSCVQNEKHYATIEVICNIFKIMIEAHSHDTRPQREDIEKILTDARATHDILKPLLIDLQKKNDENLKILKILNDKKDQKLEPIKGFLTKTISTLENEKKAIHNDLLALDNTILYINENENPDKFSIHELYQKNETLKNIANHELNEIKNSEESTVDLFIVFDKIDTLKQQMLAFNETIISNIDKKTLDHRQSYIGINSFLGKIDYRLSNLTELSNYFLQKVETGKKFFGRPENNKIPMTSNQIFNLLIYSRAKLNLLRMEEKKDSLIQSKQKYQKMESELEAISQRSGDKPPKPSPISNENKKETQEHDDNAVFKKPLSTPKKRYPLGIFHNTETDSKRQKNENNSTKSSNTKAQENLEEDQRISFSNC